MHIDSVFPDPDGACATGGRHAPFETPGDPLGRPVDTALLGALIRACTDSPPCLPCQASLLDRIAAAPDTAARLVEIAAEAITTICGAAPRALTSPHSTVGEQFALLAATGADGNNDAMYALAAAMSEEDLRAAASAAADLIVGVLAFEVFGERLREAEKET